MKQSQFGIQVSYGVTLENGTPVNMAKLETDDEIYKTMAKELESKGFKNILGCYELTAYGTTTNNMKISFNILIYNFKLLKNIYKIITSNKNIIGINITALDFSYIYNQILRIQQSRK